jgi:hypothetical protein
VAVDSTWHHFFDINLIGDPAASGDKKLGFNTPAGKQYLAGMQSYYVNLALWLARAHTKGDFLAESLRLVMRSQPLNEILHPHLGETQISRIGAIARDALPRVTNEAHIVDALHSVIRQESLATEILPSSWNSTKASDSGGLSRDQLLQAAMGGALIALAKSAKLDSTTSTEEIKRIAIHGIRHGLKTLAISLQHDGQAMKRLGDRLRAAVES